MSQAAWPLVFKMVKMLAKFDELAEVEVMVRHLVHLFAPHLYRGMLLNLHHCEGKFLVKRIDDKVSRHFRLDYFFVRTEAVVCVVTGFPEAWNPSRKCLCCLCFFFSLKYFLSWVTQSTLFFAGTNQPLQLVAHVADWIGRSFPIRWGYMIGRDFCRNLDQFPPRQVIPSLSSTLFLCSLCSSFIRIPP